MANDLDCRASIKSEVRGYGIHMPIKDRAIPKAVEDKLNRVRMNRKDKSCERRKNPQGDWSVIVDVNILGDPESVLSLDMAEYDEGGTATAVETYIEITAIA